MLLFVAAPAFAQPSLDWQELTLRQQQTAAQQALIDNNIISALQRENTELRRQLEQAKDPPAQEKKDAPKP